MSRFDELKKHYNVGLSDESAKDIRQYVSDVTSGKRQLDTRFIKPCDAGNTPKKRLEYYRKHGFPNSFDYPGGPAKFEQDVENGIYAGKPIKEWGFDDE